MKTLGEWWAHVFSPNTDKKKSERPKGFRHREGDFASNASRANVGGRWKNTFVVLKIETG